MKLHNTDLIGVPVSVLYRYSVGNKFGNVSVKHEKLHQYFNSSWSDQAFSKNIDKCRYRLSIHCIDFNAQLAKSE